jgi:hypothetical protein
MILPDLPVIDATLFTIGAFIIVCGGAFVMRLLNAPVSLYGQERSRANNVSAKEMATRHAQTEAIREQTEEMRRSREERERELDPTIRAFRESRYQLVASGGAIDEASLGMIIWWISTKSAWGRWQAAQRGLEETAVPDQSFLSLTASHLTTKLEEGTIAARAWRANDSSYKELSPDFWKWKYLRVVPDNFSIWKALICLRGTTEAIEDTEYTSPVCDWNHIKMHFPETHEEIDAATTAMRVGRAPES